MFCCSAKRAITSDTFLDFRSIVQGSNHNARRRFCETVRLPCRDLGLVVYSHVRAIPQRQLLCAYTRESFAI